MKSVTFNLLTVDSQIGKTDRAGGAFVLNEVFMGFLCSFVELCVAF